MRGQIHVRGYKSMKQLTVIIRADHHKLTFPREIRKSLEGFRDDSDQDLKSKIQILISFEQIGEDTAGICRKALKKDDFYTITSHDQLSEKTEGRYAVMIYQGDVIQMDMLAIFMKELETNDRGAYRISGNDERLEEGSYLPIWRSTFVEPYVPWINPRGVTMRREHISSFEELMRTDLRSTAVIIKAFLDSRGYGELAYEPFRITLDNISENDYTLLEDVVDDMIAFSEERFGVVEEFLQACLCTLFRKQIASRGAKAPVEKYVKCVSDEVIATHRMNMHDKLYLFEMKYGRQILPECRIADSGQIFLDDLQIARLDRLTFRTDICEVREDTIVFMGRSNLHLLGEDYSVCMITSDNEKYPLQFSEFQPFDRKGLDNETYNSMMQFFVEIPLKDGLNTGFFLEQANGRRLPLRSKLGKFAKVLNGIRMSYFEGGGYIVRYEDAMFFLNKYSRGLHLKYEMQYTRELIRRKRYRVIGYRALYFLDRIVQRKPVWLVADRPHISNDNGEHMFRYLLQTESAKKNDIYFVLREDSPDYPRLKSVGRVLKYGSIRHKVKHLQAEFIICSAFNDLMTNALGKSGHYYRDLQRFHFVYLRHGVSHNDQSAFLNRYRTNIRILVSTSRPEYEGILAGDYAYTEREVKLTGLPRFDNLYDERQKKIAILPTWRKDLQGEMENRSSKRNYVPRFKDSEYFIFYDSLIHDERLLTAMEKYGYTGEFYLHPVFEEQYPDFSDSRRITIGKGVADYQTIFRESGIMVTDFSSVAFDFAYLKKPLIYSQFDEDTFYKHHSWGKGYFTYREDGFGPITKTVDETVDELIYYMENDCQMRPEYLEKVDRFFAYTDRNNCKRVYDAIREVASRP